METRKETTQRSRYFFLFPFDLINFLSVHLQLHKRSMTINQKKLMNSLLEAEAVVCG